MMGARGPKPGNPALKILAGNPGHRPIAATSEGEVTPAGPSAESNKVVDIRERIRANRAGI
jgi:hypothetical protein